MKSKCLNKDTKKKERIREPGVCIFERKKKESSKVAVVDLNQTMKDFHDEERKFSENSKKNLNFRGVFESGADKNL